MPDLQRTIRFPHHLRDQAIIALVPFFIGAGDATAARTVAAGLLDDYKAATAKELQLATQIIALGFATLACLSAAMVVKDESLDDMLRLQGYALALDRSSQKFSKALTARRKERAHHGPEMAEENTSWDEAAFQSAIDHALHGMTEANAWLATLRTDPAPIEPPPRLSVVFAEPMTPAVLARRARR
jgi:hypothetical protein